jgi:hypothetical protein
VYGLPETRHYNNERELRKEVTEMPRGKQYVFSARTTEEGLKALNELKARLGVNWDRLLIGAINAHYGVEIPMPALVGSMPEERAEAKAAKDAERVAKAEARVEAANAKAKEKTAAKKKAKKAKAKDKGLSGEVKVCRGGKLVRTEDTEGNTVELVGGPAETKE